MVDLKALLAKILHNTYRTYNQTVTLTITSMGSGFTNPSWGVALITAPSNVPANAWAELVATDGWGFLIRMGNTTPPTYRFAQLGATTGTRTVTVRWHWYV